MIWTVIELAATAIESVLITFFVTGYHGYKYPERKTLTFCLIAVSLFSLTVLFNSISSFEGFSGAAYVCLLFVDSLVGLNGHYAEKFFSAVISIALIVMINVTVLTLFGLILRENISVLIENQTEYRIMVLFITKFLLFLIINMLLGLKHKNKVRLHRIEWAIIILTFAASLICALFVFDTVYTTNLVHYDYVFLIITESCLIVINLMTFWLLHTLNQKHSEQLKNSMLSVQSSQQSKSISELKELSLEFKKLRHDMAKHLDVISELISNGLDDKAAAYIEDMKRERLKYTFDNVETSSDVMNAVLNTKIALCKKKKISVDYRIDGDFTGFSEIDLSVLLGNLLDNAIEAAEKCVNPSVSIIISESKAYMVFVVTNSISAPALGQNPALSSTKSDKNCHGLGLLNVRDVVEKYNGMINFSEENLMFTADVRLRKTK
ncbi:MAG: sensor histidine kinase [Ruminococcus sp.]